MARFGGKLSLEYCDLVAEVRGVACGWNLACIGGGFIQGCGVAAQILYMKGLGVRQVEEVSHFAVQLGATRLLIDFV